MIVMNETEKNNNVDAFSLEELLGDRVGFEFAESVDGVLREGRTYAGGRLYVLEKESLDDLKARVRGAGQSWKKTYLCGNVWPQAYSLETAARDYGYDELDAGAQPEDRDEEKYLADRQKWYEDYLDNCLWDGMPDKAFGYDLKAAPFPLRARRQDTGEGAMLACRIIQFW